MQVISNGQNVFHCNKKFLYEQNEKTVHLVHYTENWLHISQNHLYISLWKSQQVSDFCQFQSCKLWQRVTVAAGHIWSQSCTVFHSLIPLHHICIQVPLNPLHINDEKRLSKNIHVWVPDYLNQMLTIVSSGCRWVLQPTNYAFILYTVNKNI
jgi:hypothetical protein